MPSAPAQITGLTILALLLFETLALFLRAWLQIELQHSGRTLRFSADASYLVVPPVLIVLAWPLLCRHRAFLRQQFSTYRLTLSVLLSAVAAGLLLRLAWWAQLLAGGLLGMYSSPDPTAVEGPLFTFECPQATVLALYILVMALAVPIVEETINRGFILHGLMKSGPAAAIVTSSVLFGVFHRPSGIPSAVVIGVVFAIMAWRAGFLWPSMIAHSVYNALIALDWVCLNGIWNPRDLEPTARLAGGAAAVVFVLLVSASVALAWRMAPPQNSAATLPHRY